MIPLMFNGPAPARAASSLTRAPGWRLLLVSLLMSLALVAPAVSVAAEPQPVAEDQIKAAIIYKFLAYIDWPDHRMQPADAPFKIAFLGGHDVYQELQHIVAGVSITGRPITLRRARKPAALAEPHVVFVGRDAEQHLSKLAALAKQQSFLVITENNSGLVPGGTINLKLMNGRMSFGASLGAAEHADLHLSARLLALAHHVEQSE